MTVSIATGMIARTGLSAVIAFPDTEEDNWYSDYSILAFYNLEKGWTFNDIDWYLMSMCMSYQAIKAPDNPEARVYLILGREGEIIIDIPAIELIKVEHIPEAGLHQEWSKTYGYTGRIKEIGNHIYVCGDSNQIYRRSGDAYNGHWEHWDKGLLDPAIGSPTLHDIDGVSEESIYAAGDKGSVYYYDGKKWSPVKHDIDRETLIKIKILSEEEVYIVGSSGVILYGNHKIGFTDISSPDNVERFSSIEYFNDTLFIASGNGLFTYDFSLKKAVPYQTDLETDLIDAHILEAKDGILWSFGYKDIAYFDGQHWTRVDIEGNPKIGEEDE